MTRLSAPHPKEAVHHAGTFAPTTCCTTVRPDSNINPSGRRQKPDQLQAILLKMAVHRLPVSIVIMVGCWYIFTRIAACYRTASGNWPVAQLRFGSPLARAKQCIERTIRQSPAPGGSYFAPTNTSNESRLPASAARSEDM